jgi:hypothetical protein
MKPIVILTRLPVVGRWVIRWLLWDLKRKVQKAEAEACA